MYKIILIIFSSILLIQSLGAQNTEPKDPSATEDWSRKPAVISGVQLNWEIPSDAIVLLNKNTNLWRKKDGSATDWTFENGVLTVKPTSGDIYSKLSFEDCHLHVEWRSPVIVKGEGQGRGNSGVFLQERYEVQILDSYDNETYYNGQAAAIYKQHTPLANACAKNGEWNTYDIIYKAPVYDRFGNKTDSGRITVIHNGIVVQNNAEVYGTTEYIGFPKNPVHGGGPIVLQDHGDLVSYRNIWVRRL